MFGETAAMPPVEVLFRPRLSVQSGRPGTETSPISSQENHRKGGHYEREGLTNFHPDKIGITKNGIMKKKRQPRQNSHRQDV
jgi:hypothetical protein